MSGGETSLSGTDNNSLALKYTPGYESVFINGVLQVRGSDYVATTGTTVTGLIALTANDVVMVESIVAYSVGDTYTQSQMTSLLDAKSPVSTTGLVLLNTTAFTAQASVSIDNDATSFTFAGRTTTDSIWANLELSAPFLSKNTFISAPAQNAATGGSAGAMAGYLNNSTSYTDFTITPASGTLTGGTIKVYGYK